MDKLRREKMPGNRVHERFTMIGNLLYKIVNNNPTDGDGLVKGPDSRRRGKDRQLVVPMTLRHQVMHQYHTLPVAGHAGRHKVEESIRTQYYWSGMQKRSEEVHSSMPRMQHQKDAKANTQACQRW